MDGLEKLTQGEDGAFYQADGRALSPEYVIPKGKIKTLVVENPCIDISSIIDEMAARKSVFVPKGANAYVASDFSGDTQHVRKSGLHEKGYSVFAVQFYCNFSFAF